MYFQKEWIDGHRSNNVRSKIQRVLTHLGADAAIESKESAADCHARRDDKVFDSILLSHDELSPDHHRDHFGALSERLDWEGNVFECFILARGRNDVAK